jgi:hypothetical protein
MPLHWYNTPKVINNLKSDLSIVANFKLMTWMQKIIIHMVINGPPLWSSGQSSWLQIRRPGSDSRHYQRKKVVGLKRGPLSLVSTTEQLLGRKVADPVYKNREYGRRDPSRWPRGTLYPQKLEITSPTSGGRSVGIVHSRTHTMEFILWW